MSARTATPARTGESRATRGGMLAGLAVAWAAGSARPPVDA
ncbi:hypothetical protein [Pseudonocardia nigra]|nr:hypothetical protein [Pseudonocardia nigra]